ncbi:MAG: DUF2730 family protein [Pigmentiphaga sp.]
MTPSPSNYQAWQFWFNVGYSVGLLALGVYTWWVNREKVTASRFSGLETRMQRVETRLANLPTCASHSKMDQDIDEVKGAVKRIEGRMEGIGNALDLIQTHLLNRGK